MVETYTLIVTVVLASWLPITLKEHRTPGLSRIECKLMAIDVKPPNRAKCIPSDEPELERDQKPLFDGPTRVRARYADNPYAVICPIAGPCWKNGEPTDATGNPMTDYFPNYKRPDR